MMCKIYGKGYFATEHGTVHTKFTNPLFNLTVRIWDHTLGALIFVMAEQKIATSKKAAEFLHHLGSGKTTVIPNSINLLPFDEKRKTKNQLVFVGRVIEQKGILDLINVFNNLGTEYKDLKLVIIGDGPLRKKIDQIGYKNIILKGNISNKYIFSELRKSKVFINPSYSEGMPTTVLEAIAAGVPVIATNTGSTSDIVKKYLFYPRDLKALKELILHVLSNREEAIDIAKENYERIKKFTWKNTADKFLKLATNRKRGKKVIFVRSNPVSPDPRVEKEAAALSKEGFEVSILAWDREKMNKRHEKKSFGFITRFRLYAPYGKLSVFFYLPIWWFYVFFYLLLHKFDVVHACDLDTALPSLIAAKIKRKKIIYDIFDFYADFVPFSKESLFYRMIKKIDFFVINHSNSVIIVSDERKKQIAGSNPRTLIIIYNSPPKIEVIPRFIPNRNFSIFYAGILDNNRDLDTLISAAKDNPKIHITIAGYGEKSEYYKQIKMENYEFLGKISYQRVLKETAKADALIATYDPSIRNHKFSSPNKVFEAMLLGKPIIVAKNTGIDKLVTKKDFGIMVKYNNLKDLSNAINLLATNKSMYKNFVQNALNSYPNYSWERMAKRLIDTYKKLVQQ